MNEEEIEVFELMHGPVLVAWYHLDYKLEVIFLKMIAEYDEEEAVMRIKEINKINWSYVSYLNIKEKP